MTRRIYFRALCAAFIGASVAFLPLWGQESAYFRVKTVPNAKTLQLEGGTTVRLACLQAPNVKEATGQLRPGEPRGEEAKAALARLVKGHQIRLQPEPPVLDRHGRRLAFVTLDNGQEVQQEMLKAGMAMVYPFPDNRDKLPGLLAAERGARKAKRGIWADPYWQPAQAATVAAPKERYQLVQGVVRQVASAGGNWYLNFGEDYKTDFTAMIKQADYLHYFSGQDLTLLQGKTVLLRGWVYARDGVMVDVTLPEQIEVVEG